MSSTHELQSLSDEELLRRLSELLRQSRRVESDLVAHIGEVDERRLYVREASSSMFLYCTEVLHLSEHEAYVRIRAARASRKHPMVLEMLRDGRLHLSGIAKLAPHLTKSNREMLLARATYKSKREIEELVAEIAPKPDVPAAMRKLPIRSAQTSPIPGVELGPDRVTNLLTVDPIQPTARSQPEEPASSARAVEPAKPVQPSLGVRPPQPPVEPLSPSRYKVQFTASAEFRDKLERLQSLMQADLAAAIEAAVTEKLERLEAKRYAETKTPRKNLEHTDTSPKSRYIPAAVKRAVRKRDSDRCRFVDRNGRRCTESRGLEFHHHDPFGRGGDHSPENISLTCRHHNVHLAEREYGKKVMEPYRRKGDRVSEPSGVYLASG